MPNLRKVCSLFYSEEEPIVDNLGGTAVDVLVDTGNGRGMDAKAFSKQVIRQLEWSEPPAEIVIGTDSYLFTMVAPYMPTWIWRKMNAKTCNTAVLKSGQ